MSLFSNKTTALLTAATLPLAGAGCATKTVGEKAPVTQGTAIADTKVGWRTGMKQTYDLGFTGFGSKDGKSVGGDQLPVLTAARIELDERPVEALVTDAVSIAGNSLFGAAALAGKLQPVMNNNVGASIGDVSGGNAQATGGKGGLGGQGGNANVCNTNNNNNHNIVDGHKKPCK